MILSANTRIGLQVRDTWTFHFLIIPTLFNYTNLSTDTLSFLSLPKKELLLRIWYTYSTIAVNCRLLWSIGSHHLFCQLLPKRNSCVGFNQSSKRKRQFTYKVWACNHVVKLAAVASDGRFVLWNILYLKFNEESFFAFFQQTKYFSQPLLLKYI